MAYIGQDPVNTFSPVPSKDSFTGDGSTTTFDLSNVAVAGSENALEVFVNSVRQEPGSTKAFTLGVDGSNDLKRITFTAAPANGASIYVINDKTSNTTLIKPTDLNGVELILDADADTSITADTDDRIDLKIGGVEHISFNNSSGDTVIKPMVDAKDIVFQQYDGNKILEINDGNYVAISGAAAGPGELRFYEDTDNGVLYTGFKAGNVTSSVSYVLPTADGSSGYQLTTDGSGTLSWAASTLALANDGNNRITTGTGSGGLNAEANLTFDGSALQVTGTLTVGVNDTGHDVKLFGATSGAYMLWDENTDDLILAGAAKLYLYDAAGGEHISSDGTDLTIAAGADLNLTAVTDINVPANVGMTFGNDAEKIEGDGTDLTITGNTINLTATTDVALAVNTGLLFAGTEKIESDGTDLTITVGSSGDINIGTDIGLTFGNDGEKIEGDGTDLTISGNNINLTAVADVNIPSGVGLTFATAEKIESDGTDLTITVGSSGDINIPANIGMTFGNDGEKIEGDGTDLTIAGNNINLTAVADIVIPNDVGIQFGGASEKIEGDGTDLVISANNLTIDAAADIILDAAGNNFTFKSGGTSILDISNSSSDVIIKPMVDAKDIIFQQYDGTEVAKIDDNATFNVSVAGKFAYAGTAVTSTAAELNYSDLATLGTSAASKVLSADANNLTKITGAIYIEEATLSFDATQDWDVRASPVAKVTLTANVTFDAPSNPTTGQFISIVCIQDGTGSRTIAWNAVFEFASDTAPTATTTASKGDMFTFRYNGSKWLEVGRNLALTLS